MAARLLSVIFRSIDRKINSIFLPRITAHNYDDFACDLVPVAGSDIIPENEKQEDSLSELFDGFLWAAVPKSRRSRERRATRRFGITKIRDYMTPKRNIIACLECGHYHEAHTICGNCYEKVKEETELMKTKMDPSTRLFNAPHTEVVYVYKDEADDRKQFSGKYIVEMDKARPEWFPKNLLKKGHGNYNN